MADSNADVQGLLAAMDELRGTSSNVHALDDKARLERLAEANWRLFALRSRPSDLRMAVTYGRELTALARLSDSERGVSLGGLGIMLAALYRAIGDPHILDEAVSVLEQAVRLVPRIDPRHSDYESTYSNALSLRYARFRIAADINLAIDLARRALQAAKMVPDKRLDEFYLRLGATLVDRFKGEGTDADLDEAVDYMRNAVQASEPFGNLLPGRLADLGQTLRVRFSRWGNPADLDEAVSIYQRALQVLPQGHKDLASHLSGLGGVLSERFSHYGRSDDLDRAVELLARAYELTSIDSPEKPVRGVRLADALLTRHDRHHAEDDVDRAIALLERFVNVDGPDRSTRPATMAALAGALRSRGRASNSEDLMAAEQLLEVALRLINHSDPNFANFTSNLSMVRGDQYLITGNVGYLDKAIQGGREARALTPADSPYRAQTELVLAQLLLLRSEANGELSDAGIRLEALGVVRDAARQQAASPSVACSAAAIWGRLAAGEERLEAYERALSLLPLITPHGLEVSDSIARLESLTALASDAAAAYIEAGNPERATEVLEQGRAVSMNMRLRWRADIEQLRRVDEELAFAYEAALEAANDMSAKLPATDVFVVSQIEPLLAKIRQLDGFASFGSFRPFSDLRNRAADGAIVYLNVSAARCDALIVESGIVRILPLVQVCADDAEQHALAFTQYVDTVSAPDEDEQAALAAAEARDVVGWLWDSVVEPVLNALGHTEACPITDYHAWPRVWWIPTGPLALLPIHAAGHYAADPKLLPESGFATLDRVVSTTLPSLEALIAARAAPQAPAGEARMLIVATATAPAAQPLPGVVAEVQRIAQHVRRECVTLLADAPVLIPDGAPTKNAVLQALVDANWVHFACHAVHDAMAPTESFLLLTDHQANPFRVDDLLSARPQRPRLAFFSACSTARVGPWSVDEPIHFGAAAILAGFAHAIVTLWPVFDDPDVASLIYETLSAAPVDAKDAYSAVAVHLAGRSMRAEAASELHRWAAYMHQGA